MMKVFYGCLLILIGLLVGCGDNKFDWHDADSIERMTSSMTMDDKVSFIKDMELAALGHGGEVGLNGMTVEQIRRDANKIRAGIREDNIAFLKKTIAEMESKGKSQIALLIARGGLIKPVEPGFRFKDYSLEDLKLWLAELNPEASKNAGTAQTSTNTVVSTATPQANANAQPLNSAGAGEIEYLAQWKMIAENPTNFLNKCKTEEKFVLTKSAGMSDSVADAEATKTCSVNLSELKKCMANASASAKVCFESMQNSGD